MKEKVDSQVPIVGTEPWQGQHDNGTGIKFL